MKRRLAGLIFAFLAALAGLWLGAAAGVVQAEGQCADWKCRTRLCDKCNPQGWEQYCWCDPEDGWGTAYCGPGYYVCNREGNCCPVGSAPTPAPGGGGCNIPTHKNLKVDWNYSATQVRFSWEQITPSP